MKWAWLLQWHCFRRTRVKETMSLRFALMVYATEDLDRNQLLKADVPQMAACRVVSADSIILRFGKNFYDEQKVTKEKDGVVSPFIQCVKRRDCCSLQGVWRDIFQCEARGDCRDVFGGREDESEPQGRTGITINSGALSMNIWIWRRQQNRSRLSDLRSLTDARNMQWKSKNNHSLHGKVIAYCCKKGE